MGPETYLLPRHLSSGECTAPGPFAAPRPFAELDDVAFARRIRRAIHRRPEASHREVRTASYVERILLRLGLAPFRPAPTSVAVVIGPAGVQPAIGFRADLDALPATESTGAPYASRTAGLAHVCGHDGHAAALLTLARRLVANPVPGKSVLLIWQQGEEADPSGAPMVLRGLAPGRRARAMYAFHLWPELAAGSIGTRPGPVLGSVAGIVITVSGGAGRLHGSDCDSNSVDALKAGVRLFQRITDRWAGRHPGSDEPATVTIGQLEGGTVPNRPATQCVMRGSVRALSWKDEKRAIAVLRTFADEVATATGAQIEVAYRSRIRPPVINDTQAVQSVRLAADSVGVRWHDYPRRPIGVTDDFGWYLDGMPGALIFLGCGRGESQPDLHEPSFDFDEAALLPAVDVAAELVRNLG